MQPAAALLAVRCRVSAVSRCRETRKIVEAEISQSFVAAAGSGLEELHKQL